MPLKDLTGQTFGRLTVIERGDSDGSRQAKWTCRCSCGRTAKVQGYFLRRGLTVSCGCYGDERRTTHGLTYTPEYGLYDNARNRARKLGVTFTLSPCDISIPTHCPVLGIPLSKGKGKCSDRSPSIDRLNPLGGYSKNNIRVISHRANSIKRSATVKELERVIAYMKSNGAGMAHEEACHA